MSEEQAQQNTDREIWRKVPGDYYSPSIHVTEGGGIGINVGGFVIVKPVEWWHEMAKKELAMTEQTCACVSEDAYECWRIRYGLAPRCGLVLKRGGDGELLPDNGPCDCPCHDGTEEDDDDREAGRHPEERSDEKRDPR